MLVESEQAVETSDRPGRCEPTRGEQAAEVSIFVLLILPSIILSFFNQATQAGPGFVLVAFATILRDIALVALILYLVWRDRQPLHKIGWSIDRVWTDVLLGIALFIPLTLGIGFLDAFLRSAGLSGPPEAVPKFLSPSGTVQLVLAFFLVIVVAIAEETIFRGYMIARFSTVTRSAIAAVVLSSVIFSLGHGYEGSAGVVTVGVLGLVFALVFVWRKSIVAPVVMHFLQDFIGIVLIPVLLKR